MDPISAITSSTTSSSATSGVGGLDSDAFLQLLVAQLRFQNPMEPTDGTALMQQTAQFTTVETLQAIAETQEALMGFQQVTLALGLVGQKVFAVDETGGQVEGIVDGMRFTTDGPILEIGDVEVPLANVLSVETPPEIEPEP